MTSIKGPPAHRLTVERARRRHEHEVYRQEISQQSYERTIVLPSGVDTERARASLAHGVLEVSIPKPGGGAKKAIDIQ